MLNIHVTVIPDSFGKDYIETIITVNKITYYSKHVSLPIAYKWRKWAEVKALKKFMNEFKRDFEDYRFERQQKYKNTNKDLQRSLF